MGAALRGRWRQARDGTALLVAVAAAASCAGGASEEAGGSTGSPGGAGGQGQEIVVTESEYALTLPEGDVPAGPAVFRVENDGSSLHDLAISGPGLDTEVSDRVRPGETTQLSVELAPGTYTLWCTVANHRALGMETELVVGG